MLIRRVSGAPAWASWTLALALALPWFVSLGPGNSRAQDRSEIFTIRDVPVDETAATAAEARQVALAVGQRRAFRRLMDRLVPDDQQQRIPELDSNLLQYYVQDFSVDNERTSAVRYLADLTIRFNADQVRDLLRSNGVDFAETRGKPVVVLPVFSDAEGISTLWLDANPWREIWARRPADDGLVPMIVPIGDLEDLAVVDAAQAVAGDAVALSTMAERYGAEDALVTEATLSGDPETGNAALQVLTRRYRDGMNSTTVRDNLVQVTGEPYEAFLVRAADRIDGAVQETWKQLNVLQFGNQRSILVFVPLGGLDDWLKVRRRLAGVAAVQQTTLTTLTRGEAQLEITFVGDEQRLTRGLAQRDLFLSLRADSNWELTLAERAAPAASGALPPYGGEAAPAVPSPQ
jgi:hypothetical protein